MFISLQIARLVRSRSKRLVDKRPLAPFEGEQEERHGGHEGVGQRDIEAVEKEVVAIIGRGGGGFGLIELGLDASGDPCVAALAGSPIVEDAGAQGTEIAAHQLREGTLDGRKVLARPRRLRAANRRAPKDGRDDRPQRP